MSLSGRGASTVTAARSCERRGTVVDHPLDARSLEPAKQRADRDNAERAGDDADECQRVQFVRPTRVHGLRDAMNSG